MTNDELLARLKVDKEGLIRQRNELRRDISELQRRLYMVEGALQYVSNILEQEEANGQGRTD